MVPKKVDVSKWRFWILKGDWYSEKLFFIIAYIQDRQSIVIEECRKCIKKTAGNKNQNTAQFFYLSQFFCLPSPSSLKPLQFSSRSFQNHRVELLICFLF